MSRWFIMGFRDTWASQVSLVVKNPPANIGNVKDMGLILGLGRSPEGRHGNPLQYSCLENLMDRGAWRATVHRVAKSQTQLKWQHACIRGTYTMILWLRKVHGCECPSEWRRWLSIPLLFWLVSNHHANVKKWTTMEKWPNVQGHCLQQKQTFHDVQARNGIWELAVFHLLTYTAIIRWGLSHKIGQTLRLWIIVIIWMLTLCQVLC